MFILEGKLNLDSVAKLDHAIFRVTLEDVTMVDVSSIIVAAMEGNITGSKITVIPFHLRVDATVSDSRRYVLRGELRISCEDQLCVGDFISTVAIPWTPNSTDRCWSIPLRRIKG